MSYENKPYRLCAGIMLINHQGKIFVGQRLDSHKSAWQMPQGGIESDELPIQAAFRELEEEIGTQQAEMIMAYPTPLDYDLPPEIAKNFWGGQFRGQRQYWFLMRFTGQESDICLQTAHPEFSDYKWVDMQTLPDHAVSFKKEIYQKLVEAFAPHCSL